MNDLLLTSPEGFNNLRLTTHGPLLYNRNDTYVGRSVELFGEYGHEEAEFLLTLVTPESIVIEVGANIGTHTVRLARVAKEVIAFEPQRFCFYLLCANIALNQLVNARAHQVALGDHASLAPMPLLDPRCENNFGGVEMGEKGAGVHERVTMLPLDDMKTRRCDLLKIDVEGMEYEVLIGAAETIHRFRPLIYCENDRAEKSERLITHLMGAHYRCWWHLPRLTPDYYDRTDPFPGIVSVNMICVPEEREIAQVAGLRRVLRADDNWRDG